MLQFPYHVIFLQHHVISIDLEIDVRIQNVLFIIYL